MSDKTTEPFVVKHYSGEERPIIKGNGFDGLEVGETREEAEEFVGWLNARLAASSPQTTEPVTLVTYAHPDRPAVRISQPAYVSVPLWAIDIRFETRTAPSPQTTPTIDEIMRLADDSVGCYWPSGRAALAAAVGRLVAERDEWETAHNVRADELDGMRGRLEQAKAERDAAHEIAANAGRECTERATENRELKERLEQADRDLQKVIEQRERSNRIIGEAVERAEQAEAERDELKREWAENGDALHSLNLMQARAYRAEQRAEQAEREHRVTLVELAECRHLLHVFVDEEKERRTWPSAWREDIVERVNAQIRPLAKQKEDT